MTIPNVSLMCGDCLTLMQQLPEHSVDMILCDLPYGVTQNAEDKPLPFNRLWEQYHRVCKENGAIVLFAQGLFYVDLVCSNRAEFRYDLVWDKHLITGFLNAKRMPLRQHEQIAVFYRKLPTYNPQLTQGQPLHGRGAGYLNREMVNNNYGTFYALPDERKGSTAKYPTSLLSFTKDHPSVARHRTAKPVPLLEYLIRTYTNEGDCVLDNCMGSGSTAVAAIQTGRRFIGMELNAAIHQQACNRIAELFANRDRGVIVCKQ